MLAVAQSCKHASLAVAVEIRWSEVDAGWIPMPHACMSIAYAWLSAAHACTAPVKFTAAGHAYRCRLDGQARPVHTTTDREIDQMMHAF